MYISPIVIFTYNRPDHLIRCINSLKKNLLFKKTKFFIFQDGLKIPDHKISIKYESFFKKLPKNFTVIKRKKNYGLKKNIITGISYIFSKFKTIIVCEDDLIFHKYFIHFMNSKLRMYQANKNISSISGFSYVLEKQLQFFPDEYLLKLTSSWGWATWKRYWRKFLNSDLSLQKKNLFGNKKLQYSFDYDDSQSHTLWLKKNSLNKISSWNIEWEFFNFVNKYYTLYPKKTLVENRGFDGTGTHCGRLNYKYQSIDSVSKYNNNKKIFEFFENQVLRSIIRKNLNTNFGKKIIKKIIYYNYIK
jgi:hypothetical protein